MLKSKKSESGHQLSTAFFQERCATATSVVHHSAMGDETDNPWGDVTGRWCEQYSKIVIPNGQSYQHALYPGISQKQQLQSFNTRSNGSWPFAVEWSGAYLAIAMANKLMATLDDPSSTIRFTKNADTKKKTLKTWALWWKGYMYSRVGSMYISGLIVNEFGKSNGNYVDRPSVMAEATRNFDEALSILSSLPQDDSYNEIMTSIVPDFNDNAKIVSPDMWTRMINTYKARNILVAKKITDMTPTDWTNIVALASTGLQSSDNIFTLGMTPNDLNGLTAGFHPYQNCNDANAFMLASERLIQEFKPGDSRLNKNFHILSEPYVNVQGRGWTFGTRYGFVDIEEGGSFATAQNLGQWPITPTYEENQLMLAEAKIRMGNTDEGLTYVDAVRAYQAAGIGLVSGTGLTQAQALEELRIERRIGLFLRGVAFYDARRWGVIAPESQGGGRTGAKIMVPAAVYDPEADGLPGAYPCYIEYNYMDYWDIPTIELDFNKPTLGSVPTKS